MNEELKAKFTAWIDEVGGNDAAASRLGCSKALLRSWLNGHRAIQPDWSLTIERVTERRILRQEIIPHLYEGMSSAA